MTASELPLGRDVAYPSHYEPGLLFPIPRSAGRAAIGLHDDSQANVSIPFIGHDRWHAYELSWLDQRGKPRVATATFTVPFDSPFLIESKSLKLYLNSLNAHRFDDDAQAFHAIASDLSRVAGAVVAVTPGLPAIDSGEDVAIGGKTVDSACIDDLDIAIDSHGPPDASLLSADPADLADEVLVSHLLKSNCPVTGQPDWASLHLGYVGPRINPAALLRYLVSFRDHAEFHEQCVERIFIDVLSHCAPQALWVEARYTRRGGLDINPWRATPGTPPPHAARDPRQ